MTQPTTIFQKTYDGESISDIPRDIFESLQEDFNPLAKDIPTDQYGFQEGQFIVTLQWQPREIK